MRSMIKTGLVCLFLVTVGKAAVNVYSPNTPLQAQFIADTTNQYKATVVPGLFANTFTINLISRSTATTGGDPKLITLDTITNKLISISTNDFVTAYALGMEYERNNDAGIAGGQLGYCEMTPEHFGLVKIDSTTCNAVAGYISNAINFQTNGVIVVP